MKRRGSFSGDRKRGNAGGRPAGGCLLLLVILVFTAGCSRSTLNYQIAESIGTVGVYEGGEPVESPQMKSEREQREIAESEDNVFQGQLNEAAAYAASYFYEDAIEVMRDLFSETFKDNGWMERAVITGITRIAKESLFSEMVSAPGHWADTRRHPDRLRRSIPAFCGAAFWTSHCKDTGNKLWEAVLFQTGILPHFLQSV